MNDSFAFFRRENSRRINTPNAKLRSTRSMTLSNFTPQIHKSQNITDNNIPTFTKKRFTTPNRPHTTGFIPTPLKMEEFSSCEEEVSFQSSSSNNEFEYDVQLLKSQIEAVDNKILNATNSAKDKENAFNIEIQRKELILQNLIEQSKLTKDEELTNQYNENLKTIKQMKAEVDAKKEYIDLLESAESKYTKYIEDSNYIQSICENDTQEVYDIAAKMINLKVSFPLDKQQKINAQLENELYNSEQEKSVFDSIIPPLQKDNDDLESEINDLTQKIEEIQLQNKTVLQNQKEWNSNDYILTDSLNKAKAQLHIETKQQIKTEKKYFVQQVKQLVTENKTMKLNIQWKTQDGKLLQDEIERINYDISNYIDEADKKIERLKNSIQDLKERQTIMSSNQMIAKTPQPFKRKNPTQRQRSPEGSQ